MAKIDFVFEVSSEAARQVGGIYTVLKSKAPYMIKNFGDNYGLIGFWDERCATDFKEEKAPADIEKMMGELCARGLECHFGRWVYGGNARVILIDAKKLGEMQVQYEDGRPKTDKNVNYFKFLLWKNFGIDSLMESAWDFNENVVWGFGVGMLLEEFMQLDRFKGKRVIAQFHEWIAGAALLYCKMKGVPVATVFTTHATVLGRSFASMGRDVLAEASEPGKRINISEAYRFKVEGKHQLETQAAQKADVFTTVSETVAEEVAYILGRKADIVTLNGMDFSKREDSRTVEKLTKYTRRELLQFCESYFVAYHRQSYKNALLVFISGRYEYTNKGFDIYLEALGSLNKRLKKKKTEKRIFAFVFAPSAVSGPRVAVIKNYLLLDKIDEVLEALPECKLKPYSKEYVNLQETVETLKGEKKQDMLNMAKGFVKDFNKPLINAFDLNYNSDKVVNECLALGLHNNPDDVVKVIFYPTYLKSNDGLLDMNYYDALAGMDVGIFPSRYEPFGYTPVEAGLKMDVAITSDTTGFGRFIEGKANLKGRGVRVIKMFKKPKEESVEELADELEKLYNADEKELARLKKDAFKLVHLCDWKNLIKNYLDAYALALKRAGKPQG